jgi:hypothetical protein
MGRGCHGSGTIVTRVTWTPTQGARDSKVVFWSPGATVSARSAAASPVDRVTTTLLSSDGTRLFAAVAPYVMGNQFRLDVALDCSSVPYRALPDTARATPDARSGPDGTLARLLVPGLVTAGLFVLRRRQAY